MTGPIRVLFAEAAVRLILIVRLPFPAVATSLLHHDITVVSVWVIGSGGLETRAAEALYARKAQGHVEEERW